LLFYIRKLFSLRLRARSFFFKTKILPPLIFYFLSPFAPLCYVFPTLCLSLFFFPFSSKIPPVIFFSGRSLFSLLYYFPFFFSFFFFSVLPLFLFFTLQLPPSFYFVSLPLFISRKRERGHPALSRQGAGLHQGGEGRERGK
jgi:hypothetical protein